MSFGFRVLTPNGKITAGSDLANLFFAGKSMLNIAEGGTLEPAVPEGSLIFYKSSLPLVKVGNMLYLASLGQWNGNWWYGQGAVSGTVQYFVFSPPAPVNPEVFGINVFDEFGNPTFNNAAKALKVVSVINRHEDSYQLAQTLRVYRPFTANVGLAGYSGDLAFSMGGTRVYWTSIQLASGGVFFTDTYRSVRGMFLDSNNTFSTSTIRTGFRRYGGSTGNFNYSPNGSMPVSMVVADVTGL